MKDREREMWQQAIRQVFLDCPNMPGNKWQFFLEWWWYVCHG